MAADAGTSTPDQPCEKNLGAAGFRQVREGDELPDYFRVNTTLLSEAEHPSLLVPWRRVNPPTRLPEMVCGAAGATIVPQIPRI